MLPRDKAKQAAKSLQCSKMAIGGAKVSIAKAVIGPTPGIVCKRRVSAPCAASRAVACSSTAIFCDGPRSDRGRRAITQRREVKASPLHPRSPRLGPSHSTALVALRRNHGVTDANACDRGIHLEPRRAQNGNPCSSTAPSMSPYPSFGW